MTGVCSKCASQAQHEIGTTSFCAVHHAEFVAEIKGRLLTPETHAGIGRQVGELLPEWGPGWAILRCDQCSAEWGGHDLDPCSWCLDRAAVVLSEQARMVLRRPHISPDDQRYLETMNSWAERLGHAVRAGIISEAQGRAALTRIPS